MRVHNKISVLLYILLFLIGMTAKQLLLVIELANSPTWCEMNLIEWQS